MELVQTTIITATTSALISAIVGALVASVKGRARKETDKVAALNSGMRALLWRELETFHAQAMADGGLDVEARRHLEDVYKSYHDLGGNGTGTRLYEDAMGMPVVD